MTDVPKTAEPPVKAQCSTPKLAYRLMRGDRMIGEALAIGNGLWRPYTIEGAPIGVMRFDTPKEVAAWVQSTGLGK